MAKGKFGETMAVATAAIGEKSKNPMAALIPALTALILAGGEAYLSADHAKDVTHKSAKSEEELANAIEANAKSLAEGMKALAELQKERIALEKEFRKHVSALQAVARRHDTRINALSVSVQVEARLREEREKRAVEEHSHTHSQPERPAESAPVEAAPAEEATPVVEPKVSPEVANLPAAPRAPKPLSQKKLHRIRDAAQMRHVPRTWAKEAH